MMRYCDCSNKELHGLAKKHGSRNAAATLFERTNYDDKEAKHYADDLVVNPDAGISMRGDAGSTILDILMPHRSIVREIQQGTQQRQAAPTYGAGPAGPAYGPSYQRPGLPPITSPFARIQARLRNLPLGNLTKPGFPKLPTFKKPRFSVYLNYEQTPTYTFASFQEANQWSQSVPEEIVVVIVKEGEAPPIPPYGWDGSSAYQGSMAPSYGVPQPYTSDNPWGNYSPYEYQYGALPYAAPGYGDYGFSFDPSLGPALQPPLYQPYQPGAPSGVDRYSAFQQSRGNWR